MKHSLLIPALFLTLTVFGGVYNIDNIPNPRKTDIRNHVSNPDGIIAAGTAAEINFMLDSLEKSTGTEVAVVIVESIGDQVIESFATSLFTSWGIGKAKQDNGLLVLFVMDQRALRFETGYGIEGIFTDLQGHQVQTESMFPYFKTGDYDRGFLQGMKHITSILKQEKFEAEPQNVIVWSEILPYVAMIYLLLMLVSFIWIRKAVQKVKNNLQLTNNMSRYKALKAEKNGILVVLNILIPAAALLVILLLSNPLYLIFLIGIPVVTLPANIYGKAIMRSIRRKPFPCTECGKQMHILSERKEDAHLKISQQFEEQLNAVDYDVFVCDDCGNEAVFTLDKPSMYSECPKCKTKAFILHDKKVIVAPSFINSGTERTTFKCKFCGYEEHNNTNIPRMSRSAGSFAAGTAAGTIFSGRGGFGGGGFSGGSFGGGMSGGGGVTGRW